VQVFWQLCLRLHTACTTMVVDDGRTNSPESVMPGTSHAPDGQRQHGPVTVTSDLPSPGRRPSLRRQARRDEWPLRSYLELGALPGAVPCARLHAKQVLWEWGLPALSDHAELLLSELMTNAIEASQPAGRILPVGVWLSSDRSRLLIQVQDANSYPPVLAVATKQDERGRGLLIVDAISTKWGWYAEEDRSGKIVWALME
jgi:anti-sigma regulatory factor (Ser/Thr protein kinase)